MAMNNYIFGQVVENKPQYLLERKWKIFLVIWIPFLFTNACNSFDLINEAITPVASIAISPTEFTEPSTSTMIPHLLTSTPSPAVAQVQPTHASSTLIPTFTVTPQIDSNQVIYFRISSEYYEIWELPRKGDQSDVIYQGPPQRLTLIEGEESDLISQTSSDLIRDQYDRDPPSNIDSANTIPLDVQLGSLEISTSKEFLAWVETYEWCPGNYCLGQETIKIMRLNDGVLVFDVDTPEFFSAPAWSPDEQHLVFHEVTRSVMPELPVLWKLDITTGELTMIGNGLFPVWSPSGRYLAAMYTDNPYNREYSELRIISIEDETFTTIKPPNWESFKSPTWSPDGTHLAFIGEKENGDHTQNSSLLVLETETQTITEVLSNSGTYSLGKTEWSPNGPWIATTMLNENNSYDLVVIDAATGTIMLHQNMVLDWIKQYTWSPDGVRIAFTTNRGNTRLRDLMVSNVETKEIELQIGGVLDWQWSNNSDEILLTRGESQDVLTPQIQIISISDGDIFTFDLPAPVEENLQNNPFSRYSPILLTW